MNDDLLNILSNGNKDIDNQKLVDYLDGKLSEKEKHEVEDAYEPLLHGAVVLLIMWLLLYWMYRRKLFLKI